jgi:hypothetical protein
MSDQNAPYDAGNQRHVERKTKAAKVAQRKLDDALRWMMSDARGRALMWNRLSEAGIYKTSMRATAEFTAFHEGRREMGLLDLAEIMRVCPDLFTKMVAEAQSKKTTKPDGEDDDGE